MAEHPKASLADNFPSPPPESQPGSELPEYTARSQVEWVEKAYQLENSKGRAWLWLKVKSRSKDSKQLPLFYSHDTISGTVEIDFDKADGAKAVTISVVAGVTTVGQDEIKFLEVTDELWNAKASPSRPTGTQKYSYSITLPEETDSAERGNKQAQTFSLPPSFSERASQAYVDYKLIVNVKKSSFRVNQTLATNFMYFPIVRADPPSPLRQFAYREGSALIGPQGDPEGWKVLPTVKIAGTVFDSRKVELECTLALATPLTYAIGSPIPITLTLQGSDEQALDVLATPSAVRLHLTRVRMIGSHALQDDAESGGGRSNNVFRDVVGTAFFWPSDEGAPEPGTRVLQGELEVKRSLKVGFVFPRFSVRYALVLSPFQAPGFVHASLGGHGGGEPLISEHVTITSVNAPGVAPRSYAPPGYVVEEEGDYNTTVGYLENGNQRFLHHGGFA